MPAKYILAGNLRKISGELSRFFAASKVKNGYNTSAMR